MLSIDQEFENFVTKYGHNVIYVNQIRDRRCLCYTSVSGEATGNCEDCYGSGYYCIAKQIKVRKKLNTMPQSNPTQFVNRDYGWDTTDGAVFYLKKSDVIKIGDYLIDLSWHDNGTVFKYKYIISSVTPMRKDQGEIAFFQVYARLAHEGDFG